MTTTFLLLILYVNWCLTVDVSSMSKPLRVLILLNYLDSDDSIGLRSKAEERTSNLNQKVCCVVFHFSFFIFHFLFLFLFFSFSHSLILSFSHSLILSFS